MVNAGGPGKAPQNVRKKLKSLRKKEHSYRKTLLSFMKLRVEDKERKSKMAYLERKLEHKRVMLRNLIMRHPLNQLLALDEKTVKKGAETDKKLMKEQEKYNTDEHLHETWGNQMYISGVDLRSGGMNNFTEMATETNDYNGSEDDSGFSAEFLWGILANEASYFSCEERILIDAETGPRNTDPQNPHSPDSDAQESDNELLISVVGDNIKNPPDRDGFKRSVAWEIERHIQLAGKNPQWKSKEELCSTLDVKKATDIRRGIVGKGNLELNDKYCAYGREGYIWGRPAAEMEAGARRFGKTAAWMMYDEPRRFLISLENWYFQLKQDEKDILIGDVFEWLGFRDACIGDPDAPNWEAWEGAFGMEITGFFGNRFPACGM